MGVLTTPYLFRGDMMNYIVPDTTVKLLNNVKLTNDYQHTMYFPDLSTQTNTFLSKVKYTLDDYTYTRHSNNVINVELPVRECFDCSYLMFKNTAYEGKWFYAFITDVEYINNDTTKITYEIDEIQTWYFEHRLNQCFVEREHTTTDVIGEHIIDEGLDTGDFIFNHGGVSTSSVFNEYVVMVATTLSYDDSDLDFGKSGGQYSGLLMGCNLYAFPTVESASDYLSAVNNAGKIDSVVAVYMCPKAFLPRNDTIWDIESDTPVQKQFLVAKPVQLDGYTPRNNKLLCYPYNFIRGTNYSGNENIYRYEWFSGSQACAFLILCTITPNPTAIMYPKDYQGKADNYDECLTLNDFPQCGYTIDTYRAWLAQNSNSIRSSINGALGTAVVGAGAAAGGVSLALMGAAINPYAFLTTAGVGLATAMNGFSSAKNLGQTISDIMAEKKDRKVNAKQMAGNNTGDIMTALKEKQFELECMCVTNEYAKSIDDYFTMFGYKVNEIKIPSTKNRPHYTYCKTVGCNITGNLPLASIKKINSIFDNGITHWVNIDEIGDYSVDNSPA